MSENEVLAKWSDLKALVESLEHDVAKNAKGTAAAGVRVRKGLRELKAKAGELVKLTISLDKSKKADWCYKIAVFLWWDTYSCIPFLYEVS